MLLGVFFLPIQLCAPGSSVLLFFRGSERETQSDTAYRLSSRFADILATNRTFRIFFADTLRTGMANCRDMFREAAARQQVFDHMFLYERKYSMADVMRLCGWKKENTPQNVGGYLLDKETNTMRDMEAKVRQGLSYMLYAPVLFLSALTGQRVDRLFQVIQDVHAQNTSRITTGALNSVLADATARVQPPTDKGRRLKIYYMTQTGTRPPHFVIFCNSRELFHFSYQRYLENQIRENFGFEGTPIRMLVREKGEKNK